MRRSAETQLCRRTSARTQRRWLLGFLRPRHWLRDNLEWPVASSAAPQSGDAAVLIWVAGGNADDSLDRVWNLDRTKVSDFFGGWKSGVKTADLISEIKDPKMEWRSRQIFHVLGAGDLSIEARHIFERALKVDNLLRKRLHQVMELDARHSEDRRLIKLGVVEAPQQMRAAVGGCPFHHVPWGEGETPSA